MRALAVRHVQIEHLGLLEPLLRSMGYEIDYLDTSEGQTLQKPLENYSLVLVLGGYMGAYEESIYPFLTYEFRLMEKALKDEIPTLGICLGAQMLAKVLGARVYRGDKGKEIGWMEVFKVSDHEFFSGFPQRMTVFQWHGDTFDLPAGAVRIYSSEKYENQAFVYKRAVGIQFHIEVDQTMVMEWAQAYRDELNEEGLKVEQLQGSVNSEHVLNLRKLIESLTRFV